MRMRNHISTRVKRRRRITRPRVIVERTTAPRPTGHTKVLCSWENVLEANMNASHRSTARSCRGRLTARSRFTFLGFASGCLLFCFCCFSLGPSVSPSARDVLEPPSASSSIVSSESSVPTAVVCTANQPCCCKAPSKVLFSADSALPSSWHTDINMLSPAISSAQLFWTVGASTPDTVPLHNDKSVCWFARASSLCLVTAAMASKTSYSYLFAAIVLS